MSFLSHKTIKNHATYLSLLLFSQPMILNIKIMCIFLKLLSSTSLCLKLQMNFFYIILADLYILIIYLTTLENFLILETIFSSAQAVISSANNFSFVSSF